MVRYMLITYHPPVLLLQICNAVLSELLQLVLTTVLLATQVPFVGSQSDGYDSTLELSGGVEVDDAGAAVVNNMVPGTQDV